MSKGKGAVEEAPAPQAAPAAALAPIAWRTEQRRIGDLVEWEKNPRVLSEKRAEDLRRSLERFGYVEEIVLNADGRSMIGGHQRRRVLLAQALLDPDAMVDVRVPSRALSQEEAAELAIRLNKNTGEWDFDMLANDFDEERLLDWGFTTFDFGQGVPLPEAGDGEDDDEEDEEGHTGREWRTPEGPFDVRAAGEEMAELLLRPLKAEEIVPYAITLPGAKMAFNRLCAGANRSVGTRISLLFNPHRMEVATPEKEGPIPGMLDPKVRAVMGLYLCNEASPTPLGFYAQLFKGSAGMRAVNEFPPAQARDLYREFVGKLEKPSVLDPCHGWGGRLVGFMALQQKAHYVGVDPATRTSQGLKNLYAFLKSSGVPGTAEFHCVPFEEWKPKGKRFDFIFTSPPYFDSELYEPEEGTQSLVRYPAMEGWLEGFMRPLVVKSLDVLKPGGTIALNVGNKRYPLADAIETFAKEKGASAERRSLSLGSGRGYLTRDMSEEANTEDLVLLRR